MLFYYVLATYCIAVTAGYSIADEPITDDPITDDPITDDPITNDPNELADLAWPERYSVKATKIELTSGTEEDIIAWKSNSSSRVDYSQGVVKLITLLSQSLEDGDKYEIHPTSTEDEYNVIKCNDIGSLSTVKLDAIVPELDDQNYEHVGFDFVLGKDTYKFESVETEDYQTTKRTVWAENDNWEDGEPEWIPVRYEVKSYDDTRGALAYHVIYDYSDFCKDFDDAVFGTDEYDCSYAMKHDENSEAVTKALLGIDTENSKHVDHVFKRFKNVHQRQYADEEEHALRRNVFHQSMRIISSVNRKNLGYKLAINQFADRTTEEMNSLHTGLRKRPERKVGTVPFPYTEATLNDSVSELPKEFDLRLLGFISPVKNQAKCGSCWSFGTTAAVEGALARANGGRVLSLANQALIDCSWGFGNSGCRGGTDDAAYDWMIHHGLPTEEEYGSYTAHDGYCNIRNMTTLYPIKGYTNVTPFSPEALKVATVNHGPLSVSVHVSSQFKLYSSGVYYEYECGPEDLNHEVSLVGYGEKDGDLFWILKNSWGVNWGVDGYMHISARDNNCGVATEPTYVVF